MEEITTKQAIIRIQEFLEKQPYIGNKELEYRTKCFEKLIAVVEQYEDFIAQLQAKLSRLERGK